MPSARVEDLDVAYEAEGREDAPPRHLLHGDKGGSTLQPRPVPSPTSSPDLSNVSNYRASATSRHGKPLMQSPGSRSIFSLDPIEEPGEAASFRRIISLVQPPYNRCAASRRDHNGSRRAPGGPSRQLQMGFWTSRLVSRDGQRHPSFRKRGLSRVICCLSRNGHRLSRVRTIPPKGKDHDPARAL
jgi:hypothetical protein